MKKLAAVLLATVILAVLLIGAVVVFLTDAAEPAPFATVEQPTDFAKQGTIEFSNISTRPPEPFVSYEENGNRISKKLLLDPLSVCAVENGSTPCLAMNVTLDVPFGGKPAVVEGKIQPDGSVLVRKLRRLRSEEIFLTMIPQSGNVFISWPEARNLILSCRAAMVMQTHSLDVYVTLPDGRKVVAVEPVIDEVFSVTQQASGGKCGNIPVATE
ncbi:hypothetical protein KW786_02325 [Candidatus Parcubacteria bacterium]|nr:hypothetical protein [Candidatus Parcubacteria bacterium]